MARRLRYCCLVAVTAFLLCEANSICAQVETETKAQRKSVDRNEKTVPPEKTAPIRVPRFDQAPIIDGKLNDAVWTRAVKLKDFYQTSPGDNIAPSQPTEVLLGYDSKALYVAFHCYDDPSKVRANIARRDDIFNDDYVGILLDTFNDHRKAYELDFNPLGVQQDGIWQDPIFNEDFNPDFVMQSKGTLTADGYVVEIAIPFKSLRYEAGKDKLWGAHFYRRIKRIDNEFDSWMPIDRAQSGWLSQAGHLTGLEGIATVRSLQLTPSLTVSETGKRNATLTPAQVNSGLLDQGRFVNAPIKLDPGLTGKYRLNPNVTLDFTVNPDFAQVEADELVLTANQRFPIFFPEKRPFFLEGTDIFSTSVLAVNTRSIIDPDVALKLSGKRGRNSFAVLAASDNGPGNISESDREFIGESPAFILGKSNPSASDVATVEAKQAQLEHIIDKNALIGIIRLKRDVLSGQSYLGFLGTSYNFAGTNSQLASLDGLISLNRQTTFTWQALGSTSVDDFFFADTGKTEHRRENGFSYAFDLTRNGRNLVLDVSGVGRSPFFRTAVGFQTRVNYNFEGLLAQYTTNPKPKAKIISFQIYDKPSILYDWQGRARLSNNEVQAELNLSHQGQIGMGLDTGYERLLEEEFGAKRQPGVNCTVTNNCTFAGASDQRSTYNSKVYMFGSVTPNKKLRVFLIARMLQDSFDFDFGAAPHYPRVSPSALAAARATEAGLCNVAVPPPVCNAPLDPGPGSVFSMNTNINFQPSTPLNFNLDFTKQRLRRNDTGLLAFDENIVTFKTTYQFTRFVFVRSRIDFDSLQANAKAQFLFGWTPNPGTALYLGYNDDVNRHGFNPFTGQLEPGLHRNARTFFIKMSYLIGRGGGT